MQDPANQAVPARIRVARDGDRVTYAVAPRGLCGGALGLILVGLRGAGLCVAGGLALWHAEARPRDLRGVGLGCALVVAACVLLACGWYALKMARARATITLDGDTLTVWQFVPGESAAYWWPVEEVRSVAAGVCVFTGPPAFDPLAVACLDARALWVDPRGGAPVAVLGPCGLGDELRWLADALSRRLGVPDLTALGDLIPRGANELFRPEDRPGRAYEAELRVSATTAAEGGKVQASVVVEGGEPWAVEVVLPPGTRDGMLLRLRGGGPHGGDVCLRVRVTENP
jgi:hypothetical protein